MRRDPDVYGRDDEARAAYTPGGFGPGWRQNGPMPRYGDDFRSQRGWGGGMQSDAEAGLGAPWTEGDPSRASVYGPARYGLGPYYRRLRERKRPDDELKQEVEEALFYDTWVDAEAVTVEVKDGIVTLRGDLCDYDEIRFATDDAWDVDGVRGVRSELRVDNLKRKPLDGLDRPSTARSAGNGRSEGGRVGNGRSEADRGGNG
jgi:BON domain